MAKKSPVLADEAQAEIKPETAPEVAAPVVKSKALVLKINEIENLTFEDNAGLHFKLEDYRPGGIYILRPDYAFNAKHK